jgi:endonuclease G
MGDAERQNDFRADSRIRGGLRLIDPRDYASSGYERGHLCPSADRSFSPAINSETFLMTNIAPQVHGLNGGPWEKLERYSRSMARRDANLYIIAGQYGVNGKIDGRITIPSNFWKVIVVIQYAGHRRGYAQRQCDRNPQLARLYRDREKY